MLFKSAALFLALASTDAKLTGRRLQVCLHQQKLSSFTIFFDLFSKNYFTFGWCFLLYQESARKCTSPDLPALNEATIDILASIVDGEDIVSAYKQYQAGEEIGSNTALLCEAADASATGAPVMDGESGDTDFPHGNIKVIATMGERSVCEESEGAKLVGVPDGMGAYLVDDDTVRVVFQSESYGPIRQESFPVKMNDGNFTMGGSHVQYIDYDRKLMGEFMKHDGPASDMVVGVGNMIEKAYNLKGEPVGPRVKGGETTTGAHYGNCDASGNYVVDAIPLETDWFFQSFCSAHLEEKHQWGEGIGLEDDIFMTNEEWIDYAAGAEFVGLSVSFQFCPLTDSSCRFDKI
jgi:hypothetical protein